MNINAVKDAFYQIDYEITIPVFIELLEMAIFYQGADFKSDEEAVDIFIEPAAVGILLLCSGQFPEEYLDTLLTNGHTFTAEEEFHLMLDGLEAYKATENNFHLKMAIHNLVNYLYMKDYE